MNGPWMWIVLGVLIAIVIGFLIVSAVLDNKKRKKHKVETNRIEKIRSESKGNVAILINLLVEKNAKKLEDFVPSVGKVKMSDINNLAKKEFAKLEQSETYKVIRHEEDEFLTRYHSISKEKSNNWAKKNVEDIAFFKKIEAELDKEQYKQYIKNTKARLTRAYK